VDLQQGPEALQIEIGQVLHRHDGMGIAHARRRHAERFAINLQFAMGQPGPAQGKVVGIVAGSRKGGPMSTRIKPSASQLGHDAARQGVHLPAATGAIAIAIGQEAGQRSGCHCHTSPARCHRR
jgi:hypothetical protein